MSKKNSDIEAAFDALMSRKIELWAVGLLCCIFLVVLIGFGSIVLKQAKDLRDYGALGDFAVAIASLPQDAKQAIRKTLKGDQADLATSEQRFDGESGFNFSYQKGAHPEAGYLLLSRYDGDLKQSVTEIVDLNSQEVIHSWRPDFAAINKRSHLESELTDLAVQNAPRRARMMHPLATPDGGLVFQNLSPLVKIDACGNVEWTIDRLFHHSIEDDGQGGFWAPVFLEPQTIRGVSRQFKEDALVHVDAKGTIVFEKSLPKILIENGLERLVFGHDFYSDDPLHLNDIQPVFNDGQFWKQGDLLLSLRNISAVVLYRPSDDKVVWTRQGPWTNQHDVNVNGVSAFTVFDNNRMNRRHSYYVNGVNNVVSYNLETEEVTRPFASAFEALDIRTVSEGRSQLLPNGDLFVEESNFGRIVEIEPDGEVRWSYVNRAKDGNVYLVNWSRPLSPEQGAEIVQAVKMQDCR
jgi:hypothetical protein